MAYIPNYSLSWGLKYITEFIGANRDTRVYIEGDKIASTYSENKDFFFNPRTGKYKSVDTPGLEDLVHRHPNIYEVLSGQDIVKKYLEDDIDETLRVDEQFNQASFLLASMVPTSYERVSTMGTATLWKMLMLAWSYHRGLAIPQKNSNYQIFKTGTFKDLPFSSDNKVSSSHLADNVLKVEFLENTRDCPVRDTK